MRVSSGIAEIADRFGARGDEQFGADVRAHRRPLHSATGCVGLDPFAEQLVDRHRRSPIERLDEQTDGAATRQADGERLVVAVPERDDPWFGLTVAGSPAPR